MTLDAYLKSRGESEEKFAKRAKISRATVFRIKRAGAASSVKVAGKIVSASNGAVSMADLFPGVIPGKRAKRSAA